MGPELIKQILGFLADVDGFAGKEAQLTSILKTRTAQQGEIFLAHRTEFKALIASFPAKDRSARFVDLINFLGTPCTRLESPSARATALLRVNRIFGVQCINFKSMLTKEDRVEVLVEIVSEIVDTRLYLEPCFPGRGAAQALAQNGCTQSQAERGDHSTRAVSHDGAILVH